MFWTILFVIFVVLYLITKFMQGYNRMDTPSQVRKIAKTQAQQVNAHSNIDEKSSIDILKEYKELLDMEIITQEEFDNKKEELLK